VFEELLPGTRPGGVFYVPQLLSADIAAGSESLFQNTRQIDLFPSFSESPVNNTTNPQKQFKPGPERTCNPALPLGEFNHWPIWQEIGR
jgi:hypothetical protein